MSAHWQTSKSGSDGGHRARMPLFVPSPSKGPLRPSNEVAPIAPKSKNALTGLDFSGVGLHILGPTLWKFDYITSLCLANNRLVYVPPEISSLQALEILDISHNKLRSIPGDIGRLRKLRELLLNNNQLQTLPYEMGSLHSLEILDLVGNPTMADPFLSLSLDGAQAVVGYLMDNGPVVTQAPPDRMWVRHRVPTPSRGSTFSVMCYNILSDKFATPQAYSYCPSWALDWEYRKQFILKEITHYSCDLVLLQEVEMRAYHNYFEPELAKAGYEGIYHVKSRAKSLPESERMCVDGCAVFFKRAKFAPRSEWLFEFQRMATQYGSGSEALLNRVMPKDNIGMAVLLDFLPTGAPLLVSNCHLTWDPTFKDVKVVQAAMLISEVETLVKKYSAELRQPVPVLIGGDFNSLPDSGVYEYLTSGKLAAMHSDLEGYDYTAFTGKAGLSHSLRLANTCADSVNFTNYTSTFKGVIDYIFHSGSAISPTRHLGSVDEAYMEQLHGCPNAHFPSDHLALVAEFSLSGSGNMPFGTSGIAKQ